MSQLLLLEWKDQRTSLSQRQVLALGLGRDNLEYAVEGPEELHLTCAVSSHDSIITILISLSKKYQNVAA